MSILASMPEFPFRATVTLPASEHLPALSLTDRKEIDIVISTADVTAGMPDWIVRPRLDAALRGCDADDAVSAANKWGGNPVLHRGQGVGESGCTRSPLTQIGTRRASWYGGMTMTRRFEFCRVWA